MWAVSEQIWECQTTEIKDASAECYCCCYCFQHLHLLCCQVICTSSFQFDARKNKWRRKAAKHCSNEQIKNNGASVKRDNINIRR